MHSVGHVCTNTRSGKPQHSAALLATRLLPVILAAACLSTVAFAQQRIIDKRLALAVVPQHGVFRGHAPLALSVSLRWPVPELIEGNLQLEWFVDRTLLGRYVIPDLALADSSVNLSVMLPPIILPHDEAICTVQGKFLTEDAVYDLDLHDIALQPDWRRILLVGRCGEPKRLADSRMDILANEPRSVLSRSFDLAPFFAGRFMKRELLVDDTDVRPEDVPTDPLRMTAFDLFVVPGESVAKLKPSQLDCLRQWVAAGGSLCVFVDSAVPEGHVAWLNQLAGRDSADPAYVRDADGQLVAVDDVADGTSPYHTYHVSLGRAVVALTPADVDSGEWKQAVLFLWKVQADRQIASLQGYKWRPRLVGRQTGGRSAMGPSQALPGGGMANSLDMSPQRIWTAPQLTQVLLPDSVRGLPLGTVCLILVLFLLAIAPGDYLLLGWLKRRRWTWVLFPTLSLVFTGYTMSTARQHLGQASYQHSITVVDVGDDGRPVRTSQFEMLYTASNQERLTDAQNELMVPLDPDMNRLMEAQFEPGTPRQYEQPWTYTGRMPRNYTVSRDIQQWSPRMARLTSLGPFQDEEGIGRVSRIDWDLLDAGNPRGLEAFGPACALRVTSDEVQFLFPNSTSIPAEIVTLAEQITRRPPTGFFTVVSQLSPTAGGNWEDVALLDPSDSGQEVLIVVSSPEDGQYVIHRRFLVGGEVSR